MSKKGYRQYCALARALDVVGERWSLLIVRNLLLGGQRFSELREGLPGIASNMLTERLKKLVAHEVVAHEHGVYALTARGRGLEPAVFALAGWGEEHWMGPPREHDRMRVRYAMTSMRRRIRPHARGARVQVTIDEDPFSFVCGGAPEVTQGRCAHADVEVEVGVDAALAFFVGGAPLGEWSAREDVALTGDPGALEVLRESLAGEGSL